MTINLEHADREREIETALNCSWQHSQFSRRRRSNCPPTNTAMNTFTVLFTVRLVHWSARCIVFSFNEDVSYWNMEPMVPRCNDLQFVWIVCFVVTECPQCVSLGFVDCTQKKIWQISYNGALCMKRCVSCKFTQTRKYTAFNDWRISHINLSSQRDGLSRLNLLGLVRTFSSKYYAYTWTEHNEHIGTFIYTK